MRNLKHHEYRLLRKADFLQWKRESRLREVKVCRRYRLSSPDEYHQYNKLVGDIKSLSQKLRALPLEDKGRIEATERLLTKLSDLGIIPLKTGLDDCANVSVSAFCRRRLSVAMVKLKFAQSLAEATALVEQGHIRIGPNCVKNPALLVSRSMEDFITWTDTSKIKQKISKYNDAVDDYDLMNA